MSDRKILIAGNWKMNCLSVDGNALANGIARNLKKQSNPKCDVLVSPPFTLLGQIKATIEDSGVLLGAQDCHYEASGAHTGDISAKMLKDVGCNHVIVGHSERRTNHNESNELIAKKANAAINEGLKTIICIGETESERETGRTLDVLKTQLAGSVPESSNAENTVIAYEPVWAIGTGKSATTEDVADIHKEIRKYIAEMKGQDVADKMKILYGGSVKSSNAAELLALEDVDGALIGGASLNAEEFWTIISNCV